MNHLNFFFTVLRDRLLRRIRGSHRIRGNPRCRNLRFDVSGRDNQIEILAKFNARVENTCIEVLGTGNKIFIEGSVTLSNCRFQVHGNDSEIRISEGCRVENSHMVIHGSRGKMMLSKNTTAEGTRFFVVASETELHVGEDCMFSYDTEVRTGDSHSIIDSNTSQPRSLPASVYLGRHVWVGAYAKILKGVTIGEECVIAMNSLVTASVPSNSLVMGMPAQVKQQGVSWAR